MRPREVFEEAGVEVDNVRYQFSQPWPFPASLMMGFIANAKSRALTLDENEIVDARWVDRKTLPALLRGEEVDGVHLPPPLTIAHQLVRRWLEE